MSSIYCQTHHIALSYDSKWDAYYCLECNEWKEPMCNDHFCVFQCYKRPNKPQKDL
jgi:hypothetical protein